MCRFPHDAYDRIWSADTNGSLLNTTRLFESTSSEEPPSAVLQTALVDNSSLNITFNGFSRSYNFFYVLYFAEVSDDVTESGERIFNKYTLAPGVNRISSDIDVFNTDNESTAYYSGDLLSVDEGGFLTFYFERASTSLYGPLLNALELLYISQSPMSLGTYERDVVAIEAIKESLQGFDSWRGDPCLPISYEWLTCDNKQIPPRIITLSLQNKNITAQIPPGIGILTALIELNLQGNNLSGSIPDFIAELPNLTTLFLQDNNLSGTIPQALLDKGIDLRLAGNPMLCRDNNTTYCGEQQVHSQTNGDSKKRYMPLVAILLSTCAVVLFI